MREWLQKNKKTIGWLLLIAGVVSVPLMTDYVLAGTNLQASLSRVEAVKEGIGRAFPIRIGPVANMDYGYGGASFQADVFYLIPALFRLMGLNVGISYKLFLLFIHLATAVTAYLCFRKMFDRPGLGLVGSMLYTWCPYRCADMYINANLGESVAWIFLPIVLLGIVQMYTIPVENEQYDRCFVTLTLGFSLLALSSTTFLCVALGAAAISWIVMGKKSFRKQTLLCVGKTLLATLTVNAWFLVPMLLRMRDASVVGALIYPNFRMRGMYLNQYLSVFPKAGDGLDFLENGMADAQTMGVGVAAVILVFLYLWSLFVKKFSDDFGKKMLWITGILMVLSCNLFPWDLLQNKNMLFSIVLALLQSPAKWGVMACSGLIWIACRMLQKIAETEERKPYVHILLATGILSFGVIQFLTGSILYARNYIRIDAGEDWGRIPMQALSQESILWRLCEVCSAVALCVLLGMWLVRRKKGVKRV